MAGREPKQVTGEVVERLPSGLFRVRLESRHEVIAHKADEPRRNFVRVLIGDRVVVELSPYDLTRGRIVRRVERQAPAVRTES